MNAPLSLPCCTALSAEAYQNKRPPFKLSPLSLVSVRIAFLELCWTGI